MNRRDTRKNHHLQNHYLQNHCNRSGSDHFKKRKDSSRSHFKASPHFKNYIKKGNRVIIKATKKTVKIGSKASGKVAVHTGKLSGSVIATMASEGSDEVKQALESAETLKKGVFHVKNTVQNGVDIAVEVKKSYHDYSEKKKNYENSNFSGTVSDSNKSEKQKEYKDVYQKAANNGKKVRENRNKAHDLNAERAIFLRRKLKITSLKESTDKVSGMVEEAVSAKRRKLHIQSDADKTFPAKAIGYGETMDSDRKSSKKMNLNGKKIRERKNNSDSRNKNKNGSENKKRIMAYVIGNAMNRESDDKFSRVVQDIAKNKVKRVASKLAKKIAIIIAKKAGMMLLGLFSFLSTFILPVIILVVVIQALYQSPIAMFLPDQKSTSSVEKPNCDITKGILNSRLADFYYKIKEVLYEKDVKEFTFTYSNGSKNANYKEMMLVYGCLSEEGEDPCEKNEKNIKLMDNVIQRMNHYSLASVLNGSGT